jgi:hypothetical protein
VREAYVAERSVRRRVLREACCTGGGAILRMVGFVVGGGLVQAGIWFGADGSLETAAAPSGDAEVSGGGGGGGGALRQPPCDACVHGDSAAQRRCGRRPGARGAGGAQRGPGAAHGGAAGAGVVVRRAGLGVPAGVGECRAAGRALRALARGACDATAPHQQ